MSNDPQSIGDVEGATPCIGVCTTLFDDVCRGCHRTAQEVAQWMFMTSAERLAVWQRLGRSPLTAAGDDQAGKAP